MARCLLDIGVLDIRVQEQVAKYGDVREFQLALWRQEPDETGCNWDAHIERTGVPGAPVWENVIPELRKRFNLN